MIFVTVAASKSRLSPKSSELRLWCAASAILCKRKNKVVAEYAQQIAAHESLRTTKLYDRRSDEVSLDEIERIVF